MPASELPWTARTQFLRPPCNDRLKPAESELARASRLQPVLTAVADETPEPSKPTPSSTRCEASPAVIEVKDVDPKDERGSVGDGATVAAPQRVTARMTVDPLFCEYPLLLEATTGLRVGMG